MAPALVIHGTGDRLVRPSGGRATARAIPGARLMMVPGMGHDLPRAAWPMLIDAIAEHVSRADAPAAGAARIEAGTGAETTAGNGLPPGARPTPVSGPQG